MRQLLSPKWILSHLFVLAMVVLMVNLGFWQLRRLDERQAGNADIRAASEQPAVDLGTWTPSDGRPVDYTAAVVAGRYRAEEELLIANRSYNGQAGSWLATPLELADGRVVVVVRGWVPRLVVAGVDNQPTAAPGGSVSVGGLVFESVGGGRIAQVGEGETPQISRMDLDRFEEITGLDVMDVWLRLRAQEPVQAGGLPIPVPPPALDDGPHLSYAFQWFFFSVGTVVVYWVILRRKLGSST